MEFYYTSVVDGTVLYTEKLLELMKLCNPFKLLAVRSNDKPWYDSAIRTFARKRDRFKTTAIKQHCAYNWAKFTYAYNRVNNMFKHAKELFFQILNLH